MGDTKFRFIMITIIIAVTISLGYDILDMTGFLDFYLSLNETQ